jgi:hypothetical protein
LTCYLTWPVTARRQPVHYHASAWPARQLRFANGNDGHIEVVFTGLGLLRPIEGFIASAQKI